MAARQQPPVSWANPVGKTPDLCGCRSIALNLKNILTTVRRRAGYATLRADLTKLGVPAANLESFAVEALARLGYEDARDVRPGFVPPPPKNLERHAGQDYQSLLMHIAAVRLIEQNPDLVNRAMGTLANWRETTDPRTLPLLDEWSRIFERQDWQLALAPDEHGSRRRQASPLAVLLPEKERLEIIQKVNSLKQFDVVNEVLGDLPVGAKVQFFFTPKGSLSAKTPLEALVCGQVTAVKNTAAAFADLR